MSWLSLSGSQKRDFDMATTKIWPIRNGSSIKLVIEYVENPDKTVDTIYRLQNDTEREYTKSELDNMTDVMEYAMNDFKTEEKRYVSGVNINVANARDEMMATKKHYQKEDGIILWHGYQSFKPGEVTADEAHKIGIELAESLWSGYEVIVSTHIDKAHIHNHFVINSVSFETGKKLDGNWFDMRRESDRLCEKYRKSVIKNPQYKGKHYAEYRAEKQGNYTWISAIKKDVDEIIGISKNMEQFFDELKKRGYRIKVGAYLTLQPPGKPRGMKVDRHLGEEYSLSGIEARIEENVKAGRVKIPEKRKYYVPKRVTKPFYRKKGFQGLYFFYCYKLGVFKKHKTLRASHYLYKEELRNINKISAVTKFLSKNKIETAGDLELKITELKNEISGLSKARQNLYNQMRSMEPDEKKLAEEKISSINERIKLARKELYYCNDVKERSFVLQEKVREVRKQEMAQSKEREV